jgi:hypothetical protein
MRDVAKLAAVVSWAFVLVIGTINDRTTGQPMQGVTVAAGSVHALSHSDGTFRLNGLKPGRTTVLVSSDDVPPARFSITVGTKTTHVDLRVCSTTLDYNCGLPQ